MQRYEDPADPLNGPEYHTGKPCIERGCNNPAGTHWGKFWCQACNARRLTRISAQLNDIATHMAGQHPIQLRLGAWMLPVPAATQRQEEVVCPSCNGELRLTQTTSGVGYASCRTCGAFTLNEKPGLVPAANNR